MTPAQAQHHQRSTMRPDDDPKELKPVEEFYDKADRKYQEWKEDKKMDNKELRDRLNVMKED